MKSNVYKILISILVAIIFILSVSLKPFKVVYAEEKQDSLPFDVNIHVPDNQLGDIKNYYNLQLKKKQNQTIKVEVHNKANTPIQVNVKVANALTSTNGGIMYVPNREVLQSTLMDTDFYMDQYVQAPSTVTLEGNQTKTIEIHVTTPNQDGVFLGGLLFGLAQDTKSQELEKGGLNFSVHNKIEYAVAIQLNINETENSANKTSLKLTGTAIESYPTQPQVHALFQNTNANIVRDVAVYYEILSEGNVLFHGNIPTFNVAPKSKVGLAIPWKAKEYKDGKYMLKVTIKENGVSKTYIEEFQITASNVTEYAEQNGAVKVLPTYSNQTFMIVFGSIICTLIILVIVWWRKRQAKQKEEQRVL
ncbi:hypothetical protein BTG_32413 (plasmid) [Bacillus thuringiensis HD-771]|uniref:DUF3324 domain-containing protein n=1 Tax=Bacillus thuringiensis HD-771 TaxID=1218175 RepID=A0A9W3P189_BACTU|nr:DUF916 domain-containing protein [Bacillus thuringiensis]AFQ19819.1 hypothetical protein BTG_32413 [Bacillus thuringiensis HD-771]MEC3510522.1 DUF916 domain-containing protein [Bacillus thuringiensis]